MIQELLLSFMYIAEDPYFWPSMAVTVMIGLFIGAVIYDGCVEYVKKFLISSIFLVMLISTVSVLRIGPQLENFTLMTHGEPLAGLATIISVTVFYLLAMVAGVRVTRHVHKGRHL